MYIAGLKRPVAADSPLGHPASAERDHIYQEFHPALRAALLALDPLRRRVFGSWRKG